MSARSCKRCGWQVPDYVPGFLVMVALHDHQHNDCHELEIGNSGP